MLVLEIVNIGENDAEALAIEIPEQENIKVKGPNINVVGALDSNDYTTAEFEAGLKEGDIKIVIRYTDEINERRSKEEIVYFNPEFFEDKKTNKNKLSNYLYFILFIVIAVISYFIYRVFAKNKKKH